MAERAPRGSPHREPSSRPGSPSARRGAVSAGRAWCPDWRRRPRAFRRNRQPATNPRSPATDAPGRPSGTSSSRGLTPGEAASLTAFMCGMPDGRPALVAHADQPPAVPAAALPAGPFRDRRSGTGSGPTDPRSSRPRRRIPPPARATSVEAAPSLLPAPLRHVGPDVRVARALGYHPRMRPLITLHHRLRPGRPGRLPRRHVRDLPGRERPRHLAPGPALRRSARGPGRSGSRCRTCRSRSTSRSSTRASGPSDGRSALRTGRGDILLGPDNGLLIPAARGARRDRARRARSRTAT